MILEPAVEAAAKVIESKFDGGGNSEYMARAILEAAAPHMLARAWDEGYGYGRNGDFTNPYRSQA